MNTIKVIITQDLLLPNPDKQTGIERTIQTQEAKSTDLCKFYSLYEFYKFYDLIKQQKLKKSEFKLKQFDLRYPIKFCVFWNELPFEVYILKRIKSSKNKSSTDMNFYIKNALYVLREEKALTKGTKERAQTSKKNKVQDKLEIIDLEKTFYTIDFYQKGFFKFPTPILYTGWTQ